MSIRPWVVVEAPDSRGLRRVCLGSEAIGSAWSPRELRRMLDRHGHPDVDFQDPASVCWRGGDSGTWPDRPRRRHAIVALMVVGLLASMVLNVQIGWPDALGALTFSQRLTGALFVLSGLAQGAAAALAVDYWGRRQLTASGAVVLLGVVIALATDSLLLLMWLEEREYTPYLLAFVPLWCWSLWALRLLVHEKAWKGLPRPRQFAAGVFVSALLTAVSLAYSTMYQPSVAPMRFALTAEFGTAREDRQRDFLHVPLKLSVKNTGGVSVYVVISDFTVYGRTARYSAEGSDEELGKDWGRSLDEEGEEEAERHVDRLGFETISSARFYEQGQVLESGQENTREHVFQLPEDVGYDLLYVDFQITYMRRDRGKLDVREFEVGHRSWGGWENQYYCGPRQLGDSLVFHGRVRHNNNLINVTREPRYVTAIWSPTEAPVYSISSCHYEKKVDPAEEERDVARFGVSDAAVYARVSVADLLSPMPSPRPARPTSPN